MRPLFRRGPWQRLSLLDRWLLIELLGPLLFFVALFTLLLLTGGVMFELVRQMVDKNLPITIATQVLLFSTPRWLAFSVPMGTLMASLFVYTRLSTNSELTALRSLGVTTARMIAPAMVVAVLMTGLTFSTMWWCLAATGLRRSPCNGRSDALGNGEGAGHHLSTLRSADGCSG